MSPITPTLSYKLVTHWLIFHEHKSSFVYVIAKDNSVEIQLKFKLSWFISRLDRVFLSWCDSE